MPSRRVCPSPRSFAAAILLGASALLAAGCEDSQANPRSNLRAPAVTPVRGGTFRMVLEAPSVIDPASVDSVYDALPVGQIFDGLVALDPGLNVIPALADTWTISRDGRVYTFHIREQVRFHDGTPLTAADVVYSIRRLLDPKRDKKSIAVSYLQVIDGAPAFLGAKSRNLPGLAAVDPHTVKITLARPYLSFLEVLTMDDLRVVPQHLLETAGEEAFRRSPVGTGPFRFVSRDASQLRLSANADYFGGAPYLDEVLIMFPRAGERDGGNARFIAGETEIVDPSSDALPRMLNDPSIEIHRFQELSVSFLGLNTGAPPLDDARVRRAIAMAIDRTALAAVASARRRDAQGILPPGLPGYSPAPKALAHDPEGARRLLAEIGYPGGRGLKPITFYSAQSTASATAKTNEILKRNLADVGIQLDVRATSWSDLIAHIEDNDAPAFQLGWVADLPDPDTFLRTLFEPGGVGNYFSFLDKETAEALERGAYEMNPLERAKIYRELEQAILAKAPLVPLFHSVGMIASRKNVHGFKPGPLGIGSLDLEHVWLAPAGGRG
jgi:peptide/nickel transport system substrate-binding protein/oligopeptide transport system substrate-binding protein